MTSKKEKIKELTAFAAYMAEEEKTFSEISRLREEKECIGLGSWSNILSFFSKISFAHFGLGLMFTVLPLITGHPMNISGRLETSVYHIILPFRFAFIISLVAGFFFMFFEIKEIRCENNNLAKINQIDGKISELSKSLKKRYDECRIHPVEFKFSNPYFVYDIIKELESFESEDYSLEEICKKCKVNNRKEYQI